MNGEDIKIIVGMNKREEKLRKSLLSYPLTLLHQFKKLMFAGTVKKVARQWHFSNVKVAWTTNIAVSTVKLVTGADNGNTAGE